MFTTSNSSRAATRRRSRSRKSGSVTLELILVMPILCISTLAIVEFGLAMANLKQVALASREGARVACQATTLDRTTALVIQQEIADHLEASGFGPDAVVGVTLQQTAMGGPTHTVGFCGVPQDPPMPPNTVRVTIRVELQRLTPNLLQAYGFDIGSKVVEHTTTLRYEQ